MNDRKVEWTCPKCDNFHRWYWDKWDVIDSPRISMTCDKCEKTTVMKLSVDRYGCATATKLESKMDEIEKTESEIKVLQKKLELLKIVEEEKSKPETLYDIIYDWWDDVFVKESGQWDPPVIEDLIFRIKEWLPKEQSAAGSQNTYVECTVEGFNDCLKKIKEKFQ